MDFHQPGLPGDLPAPDVLRARWGLVAVLTARTEDEGLGVHRTGLWAEGESLRMDDAGSTWWTLSPHGEGRHVLFGEDESSGVKWHDEPIDMLAGAPEWLPYDLLRDLIEHDELGCVYWWENGAWARAAYPDDLGDDGLDCGISRFSEHRRVLNVLHDWEVLDGGFGESAALALLTEAEQSRLTPERLEELVAGTDRPWDLPAMLRTLRLLGLSGLQETAAPPGASAR